LIAVAAAVPTIGLEAQLEYEPDPLIRTQLGMP
jgi:hypothetical protein